MKDGDYFRSVSIFKELEYFSSQDTDKDRARVGIGLSYILANKYDLAIPFLSDTSARNETARFLYGLCYIGLRDFKEADAIWSLAFVSTELQAGACLFNALIFLTSEDLNRAKEAIGQAPSGTSWVPFVATAKGVHESLKMRRHYSPLLAGVASAVVPGLGQCIDGHWVDGGQALAFNTFFGFAAYGVYLYDSHFSKNFAYTGIAITIALSFDASNILGAAKTADYANQASRERIISPWEKELWDHLPYIIFR